MSFLSVSDAQAFHPELDSTIAPNYFLVAEADP